VWDQHVRYFEARGEVRNPRVMFQSDLLCHLLMCKESGYEILLLGDFNEDVYTGQLALSLSGEFLRMKEVCYLTTGIHLPPTHNRGKVPIDAVFGTVGLMVTSVALLPSRTGVGDHRVFLIDVSSNSILGDVFPTRGRISNGLHMQGCGYIDDGSWYGWSGISLGKHEIRGTCFESADGGG